MPASRDHHYVSQFYLKHFAADRRDPWLFTFDIPTRKTFMSRPQNVAFEKDFHTINAPGQPPDIVETELAKLESDVAPALDRVVENLRFASATDREHILFFLTMLLIKSPAMRKTVDDFTNEIMNLVGKMEAQDREVFYAKVRQHIAEGAMPPDTNIERLRQSVLGSDFTIGLSTEAHLHLAFSVLPQLYGECVAPRHWNILRATEGQFVTSDRPVVALWSDENKTDPVGLGLGGSRILFPLSSTVAINGGFELEDCALEIGAEDVAKINGRIILGVKRQIYARDDGFEYLLRYHPGRTPGAKLLQDERAIVAIAEN